MMDLIKRQQKHSLFIKNLAVAIFGRATLATSLVDGKKSPRHAKLQDKVATPALSPEMGANVLLKQNTQLL